MDAHKVTTILPATSGFTETFSVPGDKSIAHRLLLLGAIAEGQTTIHHFPASEDCLATLACLQDLGVPIQIAGETVIIQGKGLAGLAKPQRILQAKNSATTLRLLSGILAGQPFPSTITGDSSLCARPMNRILSPLTQMGAQITSAPNGFAPLTFTPGPLQGIHYSMPIPSGQVKSCLLLAGLYAKGETRLTEVCPSRNHTEILLREMGASLSISRAETPGGKQITLSPPTQLTGLTMDLPGDISSAAYWIAAGLLLPQSHIQLEGIGINPIRLGMVQVGRAMGGQIVLTNQRCAKGEMRADITVQTSQLHGTLIPKELIPTLIDELPILAIMAATAKGTTQIQGVNELKVKESDRLAGIVQNLTRMGGKVQVREDTLLIEGVPQLQGATIETKKDHRIAMAFSIAALLAKDSTHILDSDCVKVSYPDFYQILSRFVG